ncbi:hypothetical protein V2J09_020743 [Rumex salicifolius]
MGEEEVEVVIVGAGICGLATALGFHRKGVTSIVLERYETLRSFGSGIAVQANGWRALDQLGVGSKLRLTSPIAIQEITDIDLKSGRQRKADASMVGEARCVRRSDLINVLADELPNGTIRFECEVLSVKLDAVTSFPILHLSNGSTIKAKVVIGCDGASSAVADFLELKPKKVLSLAAVRGFANFPNGHGLPPKMVRLNNGNVMSGKVPVDDKQVFWFVVQKSYPKDRNVVHDPELIKQFSLECLKGFPEERLETAEKSDLTSLSLTHLWYRAPWDVLLEKFRKGTVTVAGDSMHVMSPFLGQGGSAGLEDAVVLARCLAGKIKGLGSEGKEWVKEIEEAIDEYVKERRMRLVWLSLQAYLIGSLLETSSVVVKFVIIVMLSVLFRNPFYHTQYDWGHGLTLEYAGRGTRDPDD